MASIKRGDLIFSVLFWVAILMAIIIGFGSAAVADPAGFVAAIFIGALILIPSMFLGFWLEEHSALGKWLSGKTESPDLPIEFHTVRAWERDEFNFNPYTQETWKSQSAPTQEASNSAEGENHGGWTELKKDDDPSTDRLLKAIKDGIAAEKLEEAIVGVRNRGVANIRLISSSPAITEDGIKNCFLLKAIAIEEIKEVNDEIFQNIIREQGDALNLVENYSEILEEEICTIMRNCIIKTAESFKKQTAFTYRIYLAEEFYSQLASFLERKIKEEASAEDP